MNRGDIVRPLLAGRCGRCRNRVPPPVASCSGLLFRPRLRGLVLIRRGRRKINITGSLEDMVARREASMRKSVAGFSVKPHLFDRAAQCAGCSWQLVREELCGSQLEVLNTDQLAVDRPATGARAARRAAFPSRWGWCHRTRVRRAETPHRCVRPGAARAQDWHRRPHTLRTGRLSALTVSVLSALKNGGVVTPLFSAFGPEAIATRSNRGAARVPVTTEAPYRRKVERMRDKACATP